MARDITIRIKLEGGQEVVAQVDAVSGSLEGAGASGEDAGRAVDEALEQASEKARDTSKAVSEVEERLVDVGVAGEDAGKRIDDGLNRARDASSSTTTPLQEVEGKLDDVGEAGTRAGDQIDDAMNRVVDGAKPASDALEDVEKGMEEAGQTGSRAGSVIDAAFNAAAQAFLKTGSKGAAFRAFVGAFTAPLGIFALVTIATAAFVALGKKIEAAFQKAEEARKRLQEGVQDVLRFVSGDVEIFIRDDQVNAAIGDTERQIENLKGLIAESKDEVDEAYKRLLESRSEGERELNRALFDAAEQRRDQLKQDLRGQEALLVSLEERLEEVETRRLASDAAIKLAAAERNAAAYEEFISLIQQIDEDATITQKEFLSMSEQELTRFVERLQEKRDELSDRERNRAEREREAAARELEADRQAALLRRELEVELMEEGSEKRLAILNLHFDKEIELYRQRYAQAAPELFEQVREKYEQARRRVLEAIATAPDSPGLEVRIPVEADVLDATIELGDFLQDTVRPLDGSVNAVLHNLRALQQQFDSATTDAQRAELAALIRKYEELLEKLDAVREDGWQDDVVDSLQFASDMTSQLQGLTSNLHAQRLQEIELEKRAVIDRYQSEITSADESHRAQLKSIQARIRAEGTSEAERARLEKQRQALIDAHESRRKKLIDDRSAAERRFERERIQAMQAQAIAERNMALLKIALETAINVVKAFPNVVAMVAAGAVGVAQAAVVKSQPLPKFARGGLVTGPGGEEDDQVLARLSPGEFVVRARQARRHLPLLRQINEGAMHPSSSIDLQRQIAKGIQKGLGEVTFRQRGIDLVGTFEDQQRLFQDAGMR